MEMDALDDYIKGHRTKRPRPPSPVTMSSDDDHSNETCESTVEDEIMANCLIYLKQSGGCIRQEERINGIVVVSDSRRENKDHGLFVYECKTCNRNFPSFQALGGHRASHKRPKIIAQGDHKKAIFTSLGEEEEEEEEEITGGKFKRLSDDNNKISPELQQIVVGNQKGKIHECCYCGSEFSSGQALGGHMRRHRNSSSNGKVNNNNSVVEKQQPRRVFQLDLNLPAPEDDHHRDLKFQFQATAASALVDCHY